MASEMFPARTSLSDLGACCDQPDPSTVGPRTTSPPGFDLSGHLPAGHSATARCGDWSGCGYGRSGQMSHGVFRLAERFSFRRALFLIGNPLAKLFLDNFGSLVDVQEVAGAF